MEHVAIRQLHGGLLFCNLGMLWHWAMKLQSSLGINYQITRMGRLRCCMNICKTVTTEENYDGIHCFGRHCLRIHRLEAQIIEQGRILRFFDRYFALTLAQKNILSYCLPDENFKLSCHGCACFLQAFDPNL